METAGTLVDSITAESGPGVYRVLGEERGELRAASCELRAASCELRAASCELRMILTVTLTGFGYFAVTWASGPGDRSPRIEGIAITVGMPIVAELADDYMEKHIVTQLVRYIIREP